jgi:AcrR family transcriptional regulator
MARPSLASITVPTIDRLLDAAEEEFAARGVDAATLADIAARARVTRPALLYHFGSKDELYAAVVRRAFTALASLVQSALHAEGTYLERLRAVVHGFCAFVDDEPALARVMVREVIADDGPGRALLLRYAAPLIDEVVAFLEAHQAAGRPPPRAALMQVVSDVFLRSAAGGLRAPLWGSTNATWPIAVALLTPQEAG